LDVVVVISRYLVSHDALAENGDAPCSG
jgi:hypothetical protein